MMRSRHAAVLAAVVLAALVLAGCSGSGSGHPAGAGQTAKAGRSGSVGPKALAKPPANLASGCQDNQSDMLALEAQEQPGAVASSGGPLFSSRPHAVLVCVYRYVAGPQDTNLIRSGVLTGATETALLTGLSAERGSASCKVGHTRFAVLQASTAVTGSNQVAWVELGGCDRVLRPDNTVGQASRAAIKIIQSLGR
jgi:hypothetical protein